MSEKVERFLFWYFNTCKQYNTNTNILKKPNIGQEDGFVTIFVCIISALFCIQFSSLNASISGFIIKILSINK